MLLILFILLFSTCAFADYQDAVDAFKRGDYATALKVLKPLAEAGEARAQYTLGRMYQDGQGMDGQSDEVAVQWYRLAAEQGHGAALNGLGYMYRNGKGVTLDYIQAHMWWDIAASQRANHAAQNLYDLRKLMTPADIATAEDLARECEAKKYKDCFPEDATVCDKPEDGSSLSIAAFVTARGLHSLGSTYPADVFDQFVIEAINAPKISSIAKTEFSSKLPKEGETKAQYFKRKGCEAYLELSVTPTVVGAQVISGGTLGKKHGREQLAVVGELIDTSDDSAIWKDSYRHTCGFAIGTPLEQMEILLEGSEEERNEEAAKKSECGRLAGKKFAGSFLKKM